jgi:hypothetical protein
VFLTYAPMVSFVRVHPMHIRVRAETGPSWQPRHGMAWSRSVMPTMPWHGHGPPWQPRHGMVHPGQPPPARRAGPRLGSVRGAARPATACRSADQAMARSERSAADQAMAWSDCSATIEASAEPAAEGACVGWASGGGGGGGEGRERSKRQAPAPADAGAGEGRHTRQAREPGAETEAGRGAEQGSDGGDGGAIGGGGREGGREGGSGQCCALIAGRDGGGDGGGRQRRKQRGGWRARRGGGRTALAMTEELWASLPARMVMW